MQLTEQIHNIITGGVLKQLRARAKLTGENVQDRLGLRPAITSKIECGKQNITFYHLQKLLPLYGSNILEFNKYFNRYVEEYHVHKAKLGAHMSDVDVAKYVSKHYIEV